MKRVLAVLVVIAGCKGGAKPASDPVKPAAPAEPAVPAQPATPKPAIPGVGLPQVTAAGFDAVGDGSMIVVTSTGILVMDGGDATAVLEVRNGRVDPAEKEGGADGLKIPRLTNYLANLAKLADQARQKRGETILEGDRQILVALDRTTPAHLLHEVLYSAGQKEAGYRRFQILAQVGDKLVGAPVRLPERAPAAITAPGQRKPGDCDTPVIIAGSAGTPPPADLPLKPVVTILPDKVVLWSISGAEGTLAAPKATVPDDDKAPAAVAAALAEIVKRRWADGKRPECNDAIVVMAGSTIPMNVVVPFLGAVRAAADGTALFPDVLLSPGIE